MKSSLSETKRLTALLPVILRQRAQNDGSRPAYAEKVAGQWHEISWSTYSDQIDACACALLASGVEEGCKVAIFGGNRPEWAITCLAAMAIRATAVGIYLTSSAEQVAYILGHAEAAIVVVETTDQLRKIEAIAEALPALRMIVGMRSLDSSGHSPAFSTWEQFLARGVGFTGELEKRRADLESADVATLIYTSGTTGVPKAVMLDHGNLAATCRIGCDLHALSPDDRLVSYLPLAHIAEQMISVHMAAAIGYAVFWAESPELLAGNIAEVEPTIFFAVPRVWERIHLGLVKGLNAQGPVKRWLFAWAHQLGRRRSTLEAAGHPVPWFLAQQLAIADRLVLAPIRRRIGWRRLRVAASGAAPINREILEFFAALGIEILEVYGLSETCGPGTWNSRRKARRGTVGPVIPEVELRLADDGEVLLRGPNIFRGYFKDPAATAEVFDNEGFFKTGDLGAIDGEGFLTITGRKKDLLITSGGKNVAPQPVEQDLVRIEGVGDAVVIGDRQRFLAALLALDEGTLVSRFGPPSRERDIAVEGHLRTEIALINGRRSRVEQIRDFRILPARLCLENDELTPTLKVKRHVVAARYAELIAEIYR